MSLEKSTISYTVADNWRKSSPIESMESVYLSSHWHMWPFKYKARWGNHHVFISDFSPIIMALFGTFDTDNYFPMHSCSKTCLKFLKHSEWFIKNVNTTVCGRLCSSYKG